MTSQHRDTQNSSLSSSEKASEAKPEVQKLRQLLTSLPAASPYKKQAGDNAEEITSAWSILSLDETALASQEQIASPLADTDDAGAPNEPLLDNLPVYAIESVETTRPELSIGKPIGRGGMGLVSEALQIPLKRQVATKQIHESLRSDRTVEAMLQEAWITGMLEHPNIVPIHSLGLDGSGAPLIVMKRVEGVRWTDVMFTPKHPLRKRDVRDHLEWNLQILMQVCNAVAYAHSRGILHRDLKPDNVMIGDYGEIYLLDWGLSVAMSEDVGLHLPQASAITRIAGTPSYMAPEMAIAAAKLINERTDVYLLGAILHEIVEGEPRHLGSTSLEILKSALYSVPFDYKEGVPQALVEICHKAMHVDANLRFESVEAFREAIELFLQRRHAIRLSDKALRRMDELWTLIAEGGDDESHELNIYGYFRECRFGFRESLRVWEGNQAAIDGLQSALELMIGYDISREDVRSARTLMSELLRPNAELQAEIDALQARMDAQAERVVRLEQLSHDLDIEVGKGVRSWAFLLVGVICGLVSGSLLLMERFELLKFNYTMSLTSAGFVALSVTLLALAARQGFVQNRASRRVLFTGFVLVVVMLVHPVGCILLKTPPHQSLIQLMLLFSASIGVMAAMQDLRLFTASGVYLIAYLAGAAIPQRILEIMTLANFFGPALIAWVWRPGSTPHPTSLEAEVGGGV